MSPFQGQSYRPNLRAPHFASKVSYNAAPQKALQCYRPKARYNAIAPKRQPPTSHTYFPTPSNKSSFCGREPCYHRPRNDDISVMPLTLPTKKSAELNRINSALAFFMSGRLDFLVAFRPVFAAPALLVAPVVWSFLA